jgi:hypothetical protein
VIKINSIQRIAEQIVELMSDNRITLADWKYSIPFYMTQQPDHILIISNNFAEGIKYQHNRVGFDVPPEFVVADPTDNMIVFEGKEFRNEH